jgi:hypothetical protein
MIAHNTPAMIKPIASLISTEAGSNHTPTKAMRIPIAAIARFVEWVY